MATAETVTTGKVVSLHYTLTDDDGRVLDSSSGGDPLHYLHGADNIVPGLEQQLSGKAVGDSLKAVVPPELGYGERIGAPRPVPREAFPEDIELEEGMQIVAQGPDGDVIPLWIVGVDDQEVLVDRNHPLAGVTLHFDVKVMAVRDATAAELAHGHPHGHDGHDDHGHGHGDDEDEG